MRGVNGLMYESSQFKLFAARLQYVQILVPSALAALIHLTIQQGDDCSRPGQHNQSAANDAPTEQPAKKAHEGAALPNRRLSLVRHAKPLRLRTGVRFGAAEPARAAAAPAR